MPTLAVIGAQWGDEGKGKIIDRLSEGADMVLRFQGGANAGHTISIDGEPVVFHLIPSGILHEGVRCLIGPGVVVDPEECLKEIDSLHDSGIDVEQRLGVSGKAHVIFPYHRAEEAWMESVRGKRSIGTTRRGIGPAYADRIARIGIRIFDLLDPGALSEKLELSTRLKAHLAEQCPDRAGDLEPARLLETYRALGERLRPYIADVESELAAALGRDARILLEGAQGALLDVDHGTYPFVTSSNTIAGGACTGLGLAPGRIRQVLAVVKAYSTRVGGGPFPTEVTDSVGERLRERGREFGATTGRPRRCGWLDLVSLSYAVRVNGATGLAVTKLDVLDGLEELRVCTEYRVKGQRRSEWPENPSLLDSLKAEYEQMPGWTADTRGARRTEDLPLESRRYLDFIVERLGARLDVVSTGPDRGEEIWHHRPW